jgi:SAM-dependent methyltransferase
MTEANDLPAELAAEQASWDWAAAGWRRWWRNFEQGAQCVNERLVELAGVVAGMRVLDVACGIGEPAMTAARTVGAAGRVLGVDLAGQMLAIARERAAAAALDQVEFLQGDAATLALEPRSFDAALSRWGLMLMFDPVAVAARVLDVLRPGSMFAVAVWSGPEEAPFLALPRRVLMRQGLAAPLDPDAPGPYRLAGPGQLAGVLMTSGYQEVESSDLRTTLSFESAAEYVTFVCQMSSSTARLLAELPEDRRERFLSGLAEEAAAFLGPRGGVQFVNRVLLARGRAD